MLTLLCIAALAASALGSPPAVLPGARANGKAAPSTTYTIQVINGGRNVAPAALISDKFAIASASLLRFRTPKPSLYVRVGTDVSIPFINPLGKLVRVTKVLVHSDAELGADVAVLELENAVPATLASPIALVGSQGAAPGSLASVAAWGAWSVKLAVDSAWVVLPKYCAAEGTSPAGLCATGSLKQGALLVVDNEVVGLATAKGQGARSDLVSFVDLADPSVQKFIAAATAGPLPPTEAPTTDAPTTAAPTTDAPTTEAPTTAAPTTDAPTTETPTTAAPTTEAPTTAAPTTTDAPKTRAPQPEPTTGAPPTAKPSPSGKTCEIHLKHDLPSNEPLLLKDSDDLAFREPDTDDAVVLAAGERLRLACAGPKNSFKLDKTKQILVAECVQDDQFLVAGKSVELSQLGCKSAAANSARKTGTCGDAGQFSSIQIGFQFGSEFVTQIDNCFDSRTFDAVYSRMNMTPAIAGHESGVKRPQFTPAGFYENINPNALYNRKHQVAAFTQLIGSKASEYVPSSGNYFLARGHLSAKADYILGAQQRATFFYINAAPQWQTFNGVNWEKLESSVRSWVIDSKRSVQVITGIWGTATLPNDDGVETELFLEADKKFMRVPKYYWKIVQDQKTKEAVAFVGLNNPYHVLTAEDKFCSGDCSRYPWLSWDADDQQAGNGFCCDVDELRKVVTTVPADLEVRGIL